MHSSLTEGKIKQINFTNQGEKKYIKLGMKS